MQPRFVSKLITSATHRNFSTNHLPRTDLEIFKTAKYETVTPLHGKGGKKLGELLSRGKPLVKPGDKVGLVLDTLHSDGQLSTAPETMNKIYEFIKSLGLEPVVSKMSLETKYKRWAGTPEQRAANIIDLIENHKAKVIWPLFGKGGASTPVDILMKQSYKPSHPVVNMGAFSHHTDMGLLDIWAAQINATQLAYIATGAVPKENIEACKQALLNGNAAKYEGLVPLNSLANEASNLIEGKLIGGNLGVLNANSNKDWYPSLEDKILYIEQFNVDPHELDRQLDFIKNLVENGQVKAILLGKIMTSKNADGSKTDHEAAEIIKHFAETIKIPVYQLDCFGHGYSNLPLGIGTYASIDPKAKTLTSDFSCGLSRRKELELENSWVNKCSNAKELNVVGHSKL
jgi:muramoyltetrapeptide carboxypeptidase